MTPVGQLELAAASFVGSHFLLSHPLRRPLAQAAGERGFLMLYSVVALATFGWMVWAYANVGQEELRWEPGTGTIIAASLLTWLGTILFVGSFARNPALPHPGARPRDFGEPRGVFRITRHPMMWGFGLWAISHALVNSTPSGLVLAEAIFVLAVIGALLQDFKKRGTMGAAWRQWEGRTSFVPFFSGRLWPGALPVIIGTTLFLAATWAHGAFGWRTAGPFALLG